MAYRVKKFRGYRRMLRKLIRVVEDYQPDWRPDEADGREEFLELDLDLCLKHISEPTRPDESAYAGFRRKKKN